MKLETTDNKTPNLQGVDLESMKKEKTQKFYE